MHLAQARSPAPRSRPRSFSTRPDHATSAVGGSAATTSSAPAICGTSRGLHEARHLDPAQAGGGEAAGERRPPDGLEHDRIVLQAVARPYVAEADQRFLRAARRRAANFRTRLGFFEPLRPFLYLYMCGVYGGCASPKPGAAPARQISTTTGRISGRFEARL